MAGLAADSEGLVAVLEAGRAVGARGPRRTLQALSVYRSVQQLGLKLQSSKAPVDTMVIDHLEKTPTEN